MPLDPQARRYLDQLAALGAPPLWDLPLAVARQGAAMMMTGKAEDRRIPGPAGPLPVRVYTPGGFGPFPILVYFHGGGWVICGLDTHDSLCRVLSEWSGSIVVSVDYRLAPEHPFPAAVDDCYAAAAWAREHAAALQGDPARIAVGGDSAGGNLAAAVALLARDRGGPALAFQLLIYPVLDCCLDTPSYRDNAEGFGLTRAAMAWFWQKYVPDEAQRGDQRASPLRAASLRGLPPALLITAEFDTLRDEGNAYAARLREAGVEVELQEYPGMLHGFLTRPSLMDQGKLAIMRCACALQAALAKR